VTPAWWKEDRNLHRARERAALRLGHAGQGTPHGWTPGGKRLVTLAAHGRLKTCTICGRPLETKAGKPIRRPYCGGTVYVDTLEPALRYAVTGCALRTLRAADFTGGLAVPGDGEPAEPRHPEPYEERELSWPDRETAGCNDLFYERYYRAWHLTKRIVRRRSGGRCEWPGCGDPGEEYDHRAEIAAGGDPLDPDNVQLLCVPHHRRKTAAFARRGFKRASGPIPDTRPLEAWVTPSAGCA
jgi:5-methylcytosine-specific restriction endonuclease McrA